MPPVCSLCRHPDRDALDAALVEGRDSLRNIAERFGTSAPTLLRHREHVPERLALAVTAAEVTKADDLLSVLREGVSDARRLRDRAEREGDTRAALVAVRTLCEIVEKLADVGERLAKSELLRTEAFLETRSWAIVEDALAESLRPYPEAAAAVGRAMAELAAGT